MGKKNTELKGSPSGSSSRASQPKTSPASKATTPPKAANAAKAAQRPSTPTATLARPPAKSRTSRPASPAHAAQSGRPSRSEGRSGGGNGRPRRIDAEQIAIRAYFISERRRNDGAPGDPANDWIVAEQELLGEIERRA